MYQQRRFNLKERRHLDYIRRPTSKVYPSWLALNGGQHIKNSFRRLRLVHTPPKSPIKCMHSATRYTKRAYNRRRMRYRPGHLLIRLSTVRKSIHVNIQYFQRVIWASSIGQIGFKNTRYGIKRLLDRLLRRIRSIHIRRYRILYNGYYRSMLWKSTHARLRSFIWILGRTLVRPRRRLVQLVVIPRKSHNGMRRRN